MTVDLRTRSDDATTDIAVGAFFAEQFPALLDGFPAYVAPWLAHNRLADLSIDCDGERWQLRAREGAVDAAPGTADSGLLVRLTAEEFSGLVNDYYTPVTFFVGGSLDIERGDMGDFLDWWMVLRALVDRRPIHVPGAVEFAGLDGRPLDLHRSFAPDDPVAEMRHFLESAGFLHIRGLFSEQEMAAISADMDRYRQEYTEGDEKSWWATTADGARRLVRMQGFDRKSQATADLLADPRFRSVGDICGVGHTHAGLEGNAIEALVKPLDVVEGISDLPWHKDCSLGRHSYECCSLTVGVSVTGAGPSSGQLRVIAGSHRALMWPSLLRDASTWGLPRVDLPTQTGDITVHLSCTHHMAQAPVERERRVLYTSFRLPSVSVTSDTASRARINRTREAAYRTVSQ